VVLVAFVVTLVGGLSVKYGLRRYMAGYVLNCWFIIALPGDTSPRPLTRPVILFSEIRALTVAIAVAIASGLHLPNA
jgi:hypothetical protein